MLPNEKLKPLTGFLGPLGDEEEGFARGEASRNGAAVKQMLDSEGWKVLEKMLSRFQRKEQFDLMRSTPGHEPAVFERNIGQWNGMRQVQAIAEGIVLYGKQADADMESGKPAETQEAI